MNITTLHKIACHISNVTGTAPKMTINEMTSRLHEVADHCRTKREAAIEIAARIFNHECNGDFPTTDERIMSAF